jgi:hypothetical protein
MINEIHLSRNSLEYVSFQRVPLALAVMTYLGKEKLGRSGL